VTLPSAVAAAAGVSTGVVAGDGDGGVASVDGTTGDGAAGGGVAIGSGVVTTGGGVEGAHSIAAAGVGGGSGSIPGSVPLQPPASAARAIVGSRDRVGRSGRIELGERSAHRRALLRESPPEG
jgi:hypothetical protein